MNPTVYLAGPITGLGFGECTDWRLYVTEQLAPSRIKTLSPMRGKDHLFGLEEMPLSDEHPLSTAQAIMTQAHWDTQRCDIMLANLLGAAKRSIGTAMEVAWSHAYRKPLVVVMEPGNCHEHPMISQAAHSVACSLKEALEIVCVLLGREYYR